MYFPREVDYRGQEMWFHRLSVDGKTAIYRGDEPNWKDPGPSITPNVTEKDILEDKAKLIGKADDGDAMLWISEKIEDRESGVLLGISLSTVTFDLATMEVFVPVRELCYERHKLFVFAQLNL